VLDLGEAGAGGDGEDRRAVVCEGGLC
jgi:hypothetical protein